MQFLHTEGRIIVNESGREVLLCGYGLGNWMVQEGFLFGSCAFNPGGLKPFMRQEGMEGGRSIDQTIVECCGRTYADEFWFRFYDNYFGEADIRDLAERGFNSVRIPLNARVLLREDPGYTFEERAFFVLENVVDLCEQYGIYVILDLHAACAGQSTLGCDDGWDNQPHLFTDEESWERTIVLWEEIVRRYKDRAVIAGYELLNEPLSMPFTDPLLPELVLFYDDCIARIRSIDRKHILFLQGHRFASRAEVFTMKTKFLKQAEENPKGSGMRTVNAADINRNTAMDPECNNWVLTYHMYETLPDMGVLGHIFAASKELNVPVWVGETGGNNEYMTVLYEMLREQHIGVNIWCHKGEESSDAAWLCSFTMPEDFQCIRDYAQKGGPRPSYEHAIAIFNQYLENIKYKNCVKYGDRADAIRRCVTEPAIPLSIPATGFDLLPGRDETTDGNGRGSFRGRQEFCNYTAYRREDSMRIVYEPGYMPYDSAAFGWAGPKPPKYGDWPYLELRLEEGEYACYTVREVKSDLRLSLILRIPEDSGLELTIRGEKICMSLKACGCQLQYTRPVRIPAGEDTAVKVCCISGNLILKRIIFLKSEADNE